MTKNYRNFSMQDSFAPLMEDFVTVESAIDNKLDDNEASSKEVDILGNDWTVLEREVQKNDVHEIEEDDWVKLDVPSMSYEEDDWVIVDNEAVQFCSEAGPISNNRFTQGLNYLKSIYNDNMTAIKEIVAPAPSPIAQSLKAMSNIYNHSKNIIITGSAIGFMALNPSLSLCLVGAAIGASIYDNFIKDNDRRPWSNFILGTSLYTATAVSLFTNPLLAIGIGLGCGSYVKNMTKAVPLAIAGVNIPDFLAGPSLLIAGLGIKVAEKFFGYNLPENCLVNRIYKSGITFTTGMAATAMLWGGYKHFETIGNNFTNAISNTLSIPSKVYNTIMDYYKPERDYVLVDVVSSTDQIETSKKIEEDSIAVYTKSGFSYRELISKGSDNVKFMEIA